MRAPYLPRANFDGSELLDIVDATDKVIGRGRNDMIHALHLAHRGIHVFVMSSGGDLLVQRRALGKQTYPGFLDVSVGGQVRAGETYEEAAARELDEELGCGKAELVYLADYDAFSVRQREKRRVFLHTCDGPFILAEDEVASVVWIKPNELTWRLEAELVTHGFWNSLAVSGLLSQGRNRSQRNNIPQPKRKLDRRQVFRT